MKSGTIVLIILMTLIFFICPVEAIKLIYIGQFDTRNNIEDTSSSAKLYIDNDSIMNGPEDSREVWMRMIYNTPECNPRYSGPNKCIEEIWSYERYYRNRSFCTVEVTSMYTDKTMQKTNYVCKDTWNRIAPASVREVVWKTIFNFRTSNNE